MVNISKILEALTSELKPEIQEYYNNCYDYFKDLYSYKNLKLSTKLSNLSQEELERNINAMISATNSALNTIGFEITELISEKEIYNNIFVKHKDQYSDYNSFFEKGLKPHINQFLFKIILEYIIKTEDKKIKNLDLFDLLPKNYLNKLIQFRKRNVEISEDQEYLEELFNHLEEFYDATRFKINLKKIDALNNKIEKKDNGDILKQLQIAKNENIKVLGTHLSSDSRLSYQNQKYEEVKPPRQKLNVFDYFGDFPQLKQEKIDQVNVNVNNIIDCVEELFKNGDLESLYYYITILKILGEKFPFSNEDIVNVLKQFVSKKVFSTGRYHKPNPLSNFYGISILSELDLINKIELVDIFDIEMVLENELNDFLPQKLSLNFYTLLSLKLIERKGAQISDKGNLIKPLVNLDLLRLEERNLPVDMLYHIGMMILIDRDINLNIFKNVYNTEIKKLVSPRGLINNNLTDTARALLIYDLLNLHEEEFATINTLYNNMLQYSNFFIEGEVENGFNWKNNNLAFKVELRMLFWTLVASLRLKF